MADVADNHEEEKQRSMPQNPSSKPRIKTDVAYLYVFVIFCIITIAINSYGSFTSATQYGDESYYKSLVYQFRQYNKIKLDISANTATWAIVATFYLIFFLPSSGLLRWSPKMLIYIAVILIYLTIISPLLLLVLTFTSERFWIISGYDNNDLLRSIFYLIILIPTVICIKKEGIQAIVDVVDKSCRTVICTGSIVSFISFILSYLLILAFEIMLVFFIKSCLKTTLNGFLLGLSLLGGCYILSFCYYFGVAVVSKMVAHSHKSQNDEGTSKTALWESINTVYRFHLGTIAFGATFILPFFSAIVVACKHTIETTGNRTIPRIFKLVLIGHITDFTLIQTAVHGHNFVEGTKRSFNVMVKNYSISFAIIMIVETIIWIVVAVSIVLSALLAAGCGYYVDAGDVIALNTVRIIFALPFIMIVGSAANTTLICMLEKDEDEQNVRMNTLSCNSQNGNVV